MENKAQDDDLVMKSGRLALGLPSRSEAPIYAAPEVAADRLVAVRFRHALQSCRAMKRAFGFG